LNILQRNKQGGTQERKKDFLQEYVIDFVCQTVPINLEEEEN
jgi:hypothetical protein